MSRKKLTESGILSLCISALYFFGEAFKAIAPIRYYRSPIGINQILIWSSLKFLLIAAGLFCLIYFGLHSTRNFVRQLCWSAVGSFTLVCFAFGLLNIADIRPEPFFNGLKEGKIYLYSFTVLFIAPLFFRKSDAAYFHVIKAPPVVAVVFSILFLFRIYALDIPLITPYPTQVAHELRLSDPEGMAQKRKVVFVVFDEFDPVVAFSKQGNDDNLANFRRLIDGAFFAPNALPPSRATIESIPAMMLGKETLGNSYDQHYRLYLRSSPNEKIEFNQENSLFGKLPGGASSLSILGFYHPYCKIYQTADCVTFPLSKFSVPYSWRFWDVRPVEEYITEKQLELLPSFVELKSRQLVYIHLNIPHLGASFAAKTLQRAEPTTPNERYFLNLALSDRTLGSILESLKKSAVKDQEVLLIVCSDHWFRSHSPARDESNGLPALLVVKLLSDDNGIRFDKAVSTHHLTKLAIEFLRGEIKSHIDIANWFVDKAVYKTHLGDKLDLDL